VKLQITIDDALAQLLQKQTEELGLSASAYARRLINKALMSK
jgi:negative regulator of replication initiation